MQRNSGVIALVAAVALGLAACGGSSAAPDARAVEDQGTAAPATSVANSPSAAVDTPGAGQAAAAVPPVLRITASLVGGGRLDFAGFSGRPLAIWFWAPG